MDRTRFASSLVIAVALVASALVVRKPEHEAMASTIGPSRVVNLRVENVATTPVFVGTVPNGRRLVLKDFMASGIQAPSLEVLVDGIVAAELPTLYSFDGILSEHLLAGIVIDGGHELAIRLVGYNPGRTITLAGILE